MEMAPLLLCGSGKLLQPRSVRKLITSIWLTKILVEGMIVIPVDFSRLVYSHELD
jgi:hypothetical protein